MGPVKSRFNRKELSSTSDAEDHDARSFKQGKGRGRTPVVSIQGEGIPNRRSESQNESQIPNYPTIEDRSSHQRIDPQNERPKPQPATYVHDEEAPNQNSSSDGKERITSEIHDTNELQSDICLPGSAQLTEDPKINANAVDEEQRARPNSVSQSQLKAVGEELPARPSTAPPSSDAFQHQQELKKKDDEIQSLMERLQSMSIEEDRRRTMCFQVESRTENQDKDKEIRTLKEKLRQSELEKENLALRLSEAFGARLTNNNPNIADLSDTNRPTKLAERYSELYDNEWTDAFTALEEAYKKVAPGDETERVIDVEKEIVHGLVKMITIIYNACKEHADKEMQDIHNMLNEVMYEALSPELQKQLSDKRKEKYKAGVEKMRLKVNGGLTAFLYTKWELKKIPDVMDTVKYYLEKCLELCWLMVIQDPPVFMDCSIVDKCLKKKKKFKKELYREYTKLGEKIAFVVWPVLYLHKSGPVLCKGVAQGRVSQKKNKTAKNKQDPEMKGVTNFHKRDYKDTLSSIPNHTDDLSIETAEDASVENVEGDLEDIKSKHAVKTMGVSNSQQAEPALPSSNTHTSNMVPPTNVFGKIPLTVAK